MRWLGLLVSLLVQGAGFAPFDVDTMVVAPPTTVTDVTRKALSGEPRRLSWAPDGSVLYLQSRDGVGGAARVRHFQIRLADQKLRPLDEEPDWAADYWHNKVVERAPGMPWLKIDVREDRTRQRVAPFTGGFASAGTATGSEAASSYVLSYITLSYLGVEIGRFMSDEPKDGVTFGWGPAGSGAIAFVDGNGHLALVDKEKRIRPVPRTSSVLLPAWSPDGNYVAFLQKQGRSRYQLASIAILRSVTALQ
ncbi:MAG: hypothetical protein AB7H96_01415 [Vicinamibacterales bacterium]